MGEGLRREEWAVKHVSLELAQDLVSRFHYTGSGSKQKVETHGLFRMEDGQCMGVAWWIPPPKGPAISVWNNWKQVLSLTRLVVMPECPTNSASFLLASSMKLLDSRWECLVTYADTWRGHTGAIYKATNWEYLGVTRPYWVYLDPDGNSVSKKATKTRSHVEMIELGFQAIGPFPKHKFRYVRYGVLNRRS